MPQAKLPARIPGEKKKSGISAVYFFTECGMFSAAHARNLSQGKLARLIFSVFFFFATHVRKCDIPLICPINVCPGNMFNFFFH